MTTTPSNASATRPLRLWPGIIIVSALWAIRLAAPAVVPGPLDELMVHGFSGLVGTLAIAIWWLVFSRANQRERWTIAGVMVAAALVPLGLGHESMRVFWLSCTRSSMLCLALVVSTAATRGLAQRRALMVGAILIAGLPWTVLRIAGINGAGIAEFHWRWEDTPEQRLLGSAVDARPAAAPRPRRPRRLRASPSSPASSQRRRGRSRDDTNGSGDRDQLAWLPRFAPRWCRRRIRVGTDWRAAPPVALWRRPIGPGWSSFAVAGDILYTQEQRGDDGDRQRLQGQHR